MSDSPLDTMRMQEWVGRWQVGDRAAADQLLQAVAVRLEHLSRRMLRGFQRVRRDADTLDVVQNASLRLLTTLRQVTPPTVRDFFNLTALAIRRTLLDIAEKVSRRPTTALDDSQIGVPEPAASAPNFEELEQWCRFHEGVQKLPALECEIVGLIVYHGWKQIQVAELLGIDERTVRRRRRSACQTLQELIGGNMPRM